MYIPPNKLCADCAATAMPPTDHVFHPQQLRSQTDELRAISQTWGWGNVPRTNMAKFISDTPLVSFNLPLQPLMTLGGVTPYDLDFEYGRLTEARSILADVEAHMKEFKDIVKEHAPKDKIDDYMRICKVTHLLITNLLSKGNVSLQVRALAAAAQRMIEYYSQAFIYAKESP